MKSILGLIAFVLALGIFMRDERPQPAAAVPLAAYSPAAAIVPAETAVNQADRPLRVSSPVLGLDTAVTPAALDSTPAGGVGWWTESGLPGAPGNVVLFGHNYSSFAALDRAQIGDEIGIETSSRVYRYVITERHILPDEGQPQAIREANGRFVLPFGDERLTLVTCWPFPAGTSHRLVIVAKEVTP